MTIQVNATEQCFPVVLFIMLYKVVLTFESEEEFPSVTIQIKAIELSSSLLPFKSSAIFLRKFLRFSNIYVEYRFIAKANGFVVTTYLNWLIAFGENIQQVCWRHEVKARESKTLRL